jgi:hypothetical protein
MWMQKGMEVERYRKNLANPNSIPANNLCGRKVIQNSAATFKRVMEVQLLVFNLARYLDYFDNDRFDLDGAVKLKLQEALVVG